MVENLSYKYKIRHILITPIPLFQLHVQLVNIAIQCRFDDLRMIDQVTQFFKNSKTSSVIVLPFYLVL